MVLDLIVQEGHPPVNPTHWSWCDVHGMIGSISDPRDIFIGLNHWQVSVRDGKVAKDVGRTYPHVEQVRHNALSDGKLWKRHKGTEGGVSNGHGTQLSSILDSERVAWVQEQLPAHSNQQACDWGLQCFDAIYSANW